MCLDSAVAAAPIDYDYEDEDDYDVEKIASDVIG